MSKLLKLSLFYLSYTPLWISVLIMDTKSIYDNQLYIKTECISIIGIVGVWILSLIIMIFGFKGLKKGTLLKYTLLEAKEERTIVTEYMLSYILPLFAFSFTQWDGVVLFLIFFAFVLILSVKHNDFTSNILLEFLGYTFYSCTLENEDGVKVSFLVLSKRRLKLKKNETILLASFNNECKLEVCT